MQLHDCGIGGGKRDCEEDVVVVRLALFFMKLFKRCLAPPIVRGLSSHGAADGEIVVPRSGP